MSHIVKGAVAVGYGVLTVVGSATIIPLTPVLILAGIAAGTIALVSTINQVGKGHYPKSPAKTNGKIAVLQLKEGNDRFFIQSAAGGCWTAESKGEARITCRHENIQPQDGFQILKTQSGRFAFQTVDNRYIAVDQGQDGCLVAQAGEMGESSLFTLEEDDNSLVAFKSCSGKYVSMMEKKGQRTLQASATSVGENELFRILTMKEPVTITKPIEINRQITVNIEIQNYEEIVRHHRGWFTGRIINFLFPNKAREEIRAKVREKLEDKLKSRIESAIHEALSARLGEEVTREIQAELTKEKIKAAVVCHC